jgi:hypothetical protein
MLDPNDPPFVIDPEESYQLAFELIIDKVENLDAIW